MSHSEHIIKSYDTELGRLTGEIARMGELAVRQLESAMDLLAMPDTDMAARVIDADDAIDQMELQISQDIVRLLALRAPLAGDLRHVFAALRVVADIERIGDHATNIARRSIPLAAVPELSTQPLLPLAAQAATAVRTALQAYQDGDVETARKVWQADDDLDAGTLDLLRETVTAMTADTHLVAPGTHLLFMTRNIERIGDYATNIAENIIYAITGELT